MSLFWIGGMPEGDKCEENVMNTHSNVIHKTYRKIKSWDHYHYSTLCCQGGVMVRTECAEETTKDVTCKRCLRIING